MRTSYLKKKLRKQSYYNSNENNKTPRNKLIRKVNSLPTKNYKTFPKEIEEDTNILKDISCSWIERINNMKISLLPIVYKFNASLTKIPIAFFTEIKMKLS